MNRLSTTTRPPIDNRPTQPALKPLPMEPSSVDLPATMSTPTATPTQSLAPIDTNTAWTAVLNRDRRFDGAFVYAVRSTGIYCRPSCPSRRPIRKNVDFFAAPAGAESAGFRACRRCKPRALTSPVADLVRRAAEFLDGHFDDSPSLEDVAAHVKVSPAHLQRTFRRLTGLSPAAYAEAKRMECLRSELEAGSSVTDAVYAAGFGSGSRVYEKSNAVLGMTPGAYKKGGRGMVIHHTIVPCSLGLMLVAATEKGICAVSLGDEEQGLRDELSQRFPKADLRAASDELSAWVDGILELLKGSEPSPELPLDLQGTAFQWQVWNILRRIPKGATRTYKEIAEELGRPTAARAVARAVAGNKLAMVIPCHRVIRSDGELSGYRWGVERKRRLLEKEKANA